MIRPITFEHLQSVGSVLLNQPSAPVRKPFFNRIQDELLELRKQASIPCESPDEAQTLIDISNSILEPIRDQIMLLLRNEKESSPMSKDLLAIYNLVWDRISRIEKKHDLTRFRVGDIDMVDISDLPTMF
jgi:hypothetical protein